MHDLTKYKKTETSEKLRSHEIPNIPFYKIAADITDWSQIDGSNFSIYRIKELQL